MASEAMLSSYHVDDVLQEILSLAQVALPFESCAVLLSDGEGHDLVVRAAVALDPKDGSTVLRIRDGAAAPWRVRNRDRRWRRRQPASAPRTSSAAR